MTTPDDFWGGPWRMLKDVEEFHTKFGMRYEGGPRVLPDDLHSFRSKFHAEEIGEYNAARSLVKAAMRYQSGPGEPLVQEDHELVEGLADQLDALVDSVYVILGTAYLQFGAETFQAAWQRVHYANMSKVKALSSESENTDSGREPKYDIVKPPGWKAPDHSDLVADYTLPEED